MPVLSRRLCLLTLFTQLLGPSSPLQRSTATELSNKRPLAVSDIIQMTRIAGTPYFAYRPKSGFAIFSPDGQRFAITVMHGNIAENTNEYSVLLFVTADVYRGGKPRVLLSLSSSSNIPAIYSLTWSDNETIYFLGTVGDKPTQLYSVGCSSGQLKQLTHHATALISYAVSNDGRTMVFEAERPATDVLTEDVVRNGLHVSREELADLIAGKLHHEEPELFVAKGDISQVKPLHTGGSVPRGYALSISPNGHYLVLKTDIHEVPAKWRQYEDVNLQGAFRRGFRKDFPTGVLQYELINLDTGRSDRPLDAPASYYPMDALWSPDSESLILSGVHLPLDVTDRTELKDRRSNQFVVELELASRTVTKITDKNLDVVHWNEGEDVVEFVARWQKGKSDNIQEHFFYQKAGNLWRELDSLRAPKCETCPEILVDEDIDQAPKVVALGPRTKRKVKLFDLNPELRGLALGKVEVLRWKDADGKLLSGGLYFPANYVAGKRYPLVIQTHGFDPHGFWSDGPYTTSFAAQALANRGLVVLQVDDIFYDSLVSPREAERVVNFYESAIGQLERRGIIDGTRVGLVGFSRTCFYVKYALTHSARRFAAAVVSDGIDAGYLQYLIVANARPLTAAEFEAMMGSKPFNAGLSAWIEKSPGFRLGQVHSPVLIQALEPLSLLDEWEWFAALKQLGRPVDLLYLPGATHVLVKPWDRLASAQGTVDWLCFWLTGGEDPDPRKAAQYLRWRELRDRHSGLESKEASK